MRRPRPHDHVPLCVLVRRVRRGRALPKMLCFALHQIAVNEIETRLDPTSNWEATLPVCSRPLSSKVTYAGFATNCEHCRFCDASQRYNDMIEFALAMAFFASAIGTFLWLKNDHDLWAHNYSEIVHPFQTDLENTGTAMDVFTHLLPLPPLLSPLLRSTSAPTQPPTRILTPSPHCCGACCDHVQGAGDVV